MSKLRYVRGVRPAPPPAAGGRNVGFTENTARTVRAVYETDPDIARAMLPKPLKLTRPEIYIQFAHVIIPINDNYKIDIGVLTCGIEAEYEDSRGPYCFHMAMNNEHAVVSGRERFGEPKKVAVTTFEKNGDHVRASCARHGITYFELEGEIGADNGKPLQFSDHLFCYKGMPSITTPGEFDGDVFLTRLDWHRNYKARRDFKGTVKFNESPYDPLIDIPLLRQVSLEYVEGSGETGGVILSKVPGEWIAPHWVGRADDPTNPGIEVGAAKAA